MELLIKHRELFELFKHFSDDDLQNYKFELFGCTDKDINFIINLICPEINNITNILKLCDFYQLNFIHFKKFINLIRPYIIDHKIDCVNDNIYNLVYNTNCLKQNNILCMYLDDGTLCFEHNYCQNKYKFFIGNDDIQKLYTYLYDKDEFCLIGYMIVDKSSRDIDKKDTQNFLDGFVSYNHKLDKMITQKFDILHAINIINYYENASIRGYILGKYIMSCFHKSCGKYIMHGVIKYFYWWHNERFTEYIVKINELDFDDK